MSDLIHRQDAIKAIRKNVSKSDAEDSICFNLGLGVAEKEVESLTSAEPKIGEWIPVSEKPKNEKRTYLVQLDSGGMRSCRWTNVNPVWTELTIDWHWNIFDIPQYCKVVAWMDLEPYKGGEDE